jgi:hypothetical protein
VEINLTQKNMKQFLLAVDFDHTCNISDYPAIGDEVPGAIASLKYLHSLGHRIQIWTCRHGESLAVAKKWLDEQGVPYERINENCPLLIEKYSETRKMSADFYIDDKNIGGLPSWETIVSIIENESQKH